MINSYIVKIVKGKILWDIAIKRNLAKFLQQFADGLYSLAISPIEKTRTGRQNRYYWVYLGMIAHNSGHTKEEIHQWAVNNFLRLDEKEIFGSSVRLTGSTKTLTKDEFSEYLEKISKITETLLPDTTEYLGFSFHETYELDPWQALNDYNNRPDVKENMGYELIEQRYL